MGIQTIEGSDECAATELGSQKWESYRPNPTYCLRAMPWFGEGRNREGVPHRLDDVRDGNKGDKAVNHGLVYFLG